MNSASIVTLLKNLIATPSFSREEEATATLIQNFLQGEGVATQRSGNNIWSIHPDFEDGRPTLLLNSHHDTVKANKSYTRDPFDPAVDSGRLYGLGSNDAGGPLVAMIGAFVAKYSDKLGGFNLIMAATAEEEISGKNGIESILPLLPPIDMAIVGEPTLLQAAVAEKGLMVLDCVANGKPGHAARNEGENAIYNALEDINWFREYQFPKESMHLGPIRMSVTVIEAGKQHNVVPDQCRFVVDVRTTDAFTLEETLSIIKENISSNVIPRSVRLRPSQLPNGHPLDKVIDQLDIEKYGSPTLSDQALLNCPSVKIGPGDSARSHSADEFIYIEEINAGLELYKKILTNLSKNL